MEGTSGDEPVQPPARARTLCSPVSQAGFGFDGGRSLLVLVFWCVLGVFCVIFFFNFVASGLLGIFCMWST